MHLQNYLQNQNSHHLITSLIEQFHFQEGEDEKDQLRKQYQEALDEMVFKIKPHLSDDFALFFYPVFQDEHDKAISMDYRCVAIDPDEFTKSMPIPLFGECHRSIYHYNLALTDWKEVLGYQVYDLEQLEANEIALAHLLHEMTWYGRDYKGCRKEQLSFFSHLEEKLLSQEGQIAFDQVFEEIGVEPHHPFLLGVDDLKIYENHLSQLAYVRAFNRHVADQNY